MGTGDFWAPKMRTYQQYSAIVSQNGGLSDNNGDPTSTNSTIFDTKLRFPAEYIKNQEPGDLNWFNHSLILLILVDILESWVGLVGVFSLFQGEIHRLGICRAFLLQAAALEHIQKKHCPRRG